MLLYAFETYLKNGDKSPDIIFSALHNVLEIIKTNIWPLSKYQEKDLIYSPHYKNLISCSTGITSFIDKINEHNNLFPPAFAIQAGTYNYFKKNQNIYGAIAYGLYEIIESLSTSTHQFESIRDMLLELYPHPTQPTKVLTAIQERLDILFKEKISDNLNQLHYPALTASFIYSFSLCEPDKAIIPIHKTLLEELKKHYLLMYKLNEQIALDMLPDDTQINILEKKFVRKHPLRWLRNKTTEELTLNG